MKDGIYRNTCPRNCYGTCGILSYVQNNELIKVTGDPKNGYTAGKLCAKGYASKQYVYNEKRIKYPMKQVPRGSGNWVRISWEDAYSIISEKIVELYNRYGSHLACGYNKYSGNLGLLHYATEGMFNSLGPHTKPKGNPCALTGKSAINKSFGQDFSAVPEKMANAKLIVIWGANPAVTNIHQMKYIFKARKAGAKLIVIDPIFTETAKKADLYIQINPGTDSYLAMAIAKLLIEKDSYAKEFLEKYTNGWHELKQELLKIPLHDLLARTGTSLEAAEELAVLYSTMSPSVTWHGLGIQRNDKGWTSIAAVNSLAAISGQFDNPNGGFYYMHFDVEQFPLNLFNHVGPKHPDIPSSRTIDIGNFAKNALELNEPPLKFLWIASRNIITQDQNLRDWEILFSQLELIVAVDLYMTKTVERADLVLPAATQFEEEDLNVGYWHYWLSLNQKAIPAYYEAKSDLLIARELTEALNKLSPGISNFPSEKEPIDWIKDELTNEIKELYGIKGYEDLVDGPSLRKQEPHYSVENKKFNLISLSESDICQQIENREKELAVVQDMYRLITPQSLLKIHSQFELVPWLSNEGEDDVIEISLQAAERYNIQNGTKIEVFNVHGSFVGKAHVNPTLPSQVIVASQAGKNPINHLINHQKDTADTEECTSTYFYDSMVLIKKWRENHV